MDLENAIAAELKRLDLLSLAEDQLECLRDSSRLQEAAGMLEDLRDRCGIRLPMPQGETLGGPFPSADEAIEAALEFLGAFVVLAVDEMATDESRSGEGENEHYITGYEGAHAVLALADRPGWLVWWVNGERQTEDDGGIV